MTEAAPQEFWQGVEEFNNREYYACHDTLEALWMESAEPEKNFIKAFCKSQSPSIIWEITIGAVP